MKLVRLLDREGETLVSDPVNQVILRELVTNEHSVSDLAKQLSLPTLKLWRRMQKLQKACLVEQTGTEKIGNLEKKLYRSTAAWFAPQQYFNFKPKDPNLNDAFEIYSDIQKSMMAKLSAYNEIPRNSDPVDFSLFVNMLVFADVCARPAVQEKILELKEKLSRFNSQVEQ